MGLGREFANETSEMHYQKAAFPMQSAIVWGQKNGELVKLYLHNFAEVEIPKNAAYSCEFLKSNFDL